MRSAFVIILLIFSLRSHGQANLKPIDSTQLLAGIRLAKGVESHFIGCYGSHSALHANVDSLINLIGRPAFESYFFDTSHILKYYAFLSILEVNEHLAFERLQQIIHDSSEIDYEFAGQNRGSEKFNAFWPFTTTNLLSGNTIMAATLRTMANYIYFHGEVRKNGRRKRNW